MPVTQECKDGKIGISSRIYDCQAHVFRSRGYSFYHRLCFELALPSAIRSNPHIRRIQDITVTSSHQRVCQSFMLFKV